MREVEEHLALLTEDDWMDSGLVQALVWVQSQVHRTERHLPPHLQTQVQTEPEEAEVATHAVAAVEQPTALMVEQ